MALKSETKNRNRKLLGERIRATRTQLGMTQKELADRIGTELIPYFTLISQLEKGSVTMKAPLWVPIGKALGFDLTEWLPLCLHALEPKVYQALYGTASRARVAASLAEFHK